MQGSKLVAFAGGGGVDACLQLSHVTVNHQHQQPRSAATAMCALVLTGGSAAVARGCKLDGMAMADGGTSIALHDCQAISLLLCGAARGVATGCTFAGLPDLAVLHAHDTAQLHARGSQMCLTVPQGEDSAADVVLVSRR